MATGPGGPGLPAPTPRRRRPGSSPYRQLHPPVVAICPRRARPDPRRPEFTTWAFTVIMRDANDIATSVTTRRQCRMATPDRRPGLQILPTSFPQLSAASRQFPTMPRQPGANFLQLAGNFLEVGAASLHVSAAPREVSASPLHAGGASLHAAGAPSKPGGAPLRLAVAPRQVAGNFLRASGTSRQVAASSTRRYAMPLRLDASARQARPMPPPDPVMPAPRRSWRLLAAGCFPCSLHPPSEQGRTTPGAASRPSLKSVTSSGAKP